VIAANVSGSVGLTPKRSVFIKRVRARAPPKPSSAPTSASVIPSLIISFSTSLLCAPYIESLRDNKRLKGALGGITAAVVGVILNLSLVFGAAVIWPRGLAGGTEWFTAAMSIAAFFALYKLKADVLWVVIAGGLIGLGRALLIR
jgi:chromate transporter